MNETAESEHRGPGTLEPMADSDIEQVVAIEAECFSNPWPEHVFRSVLLSRSGYTLVAREGDRVLGYLVAHLHQPDLELLNIAVHPDHRRGGLGRRLLARVLEVAKTAGCAGVVLSVRPSKPGAIRLYKTFGFRLVGTWPGYYRLPREDALIMRKPLWRPGTGDDPGS